MSFIAIVLVVASATLHASWNLIAKKNAMSVVFYAQLSIVSTIFWGHIQLWSPVEISNLSAGFWLSIAASIACDTLYCAGLVGAYRTMEMATAYPIMRSLPILLTAMVTGLLGWGAPLGIIAKLGFLIVFAGAMLMPLTRISDFKLSNYLSRNMWYVLLAACGTTGYTIFDSRAQFFMREITEGISKPMVSLTYYSMRSTCLSLALATLVILSPQNRKLAREYWQKRNFSPLLASICASSTYILVLLAMNYVTNVSYIQVFRQLGLPIGMAAGVWILKERCTMIKCIGVTLILIGLAMSVVK